VSNWQREARVVDAEVFADHGFANIFVANEVVVGPLFTACHYPK